MDRLFDDFFSGWLAPAGRRFGTDPPRRFQVPLGMTHPAVDVAENDHEYRISAELPGMTDKDVEVTLANGTLVLKGEKRQEKEERAEGYYVSERHYGSFQRAFRLPDDVKADAIEAQLRDGVLTVMLPKSAKLRAEHRKVEIKAS